MSEKKTRKVSICEDPDQQPLRMKIFAQRVGTVGKNYINGKPKEFLQ